jgi:hypothetical protein
VGISCTARDVGILERQEFQKKGLDFVPVWRSISNGITTRRRDWLSDFDRPV